MFESFIIVFGAFIFWIVNICFFMNNGGTSCTQSMKNRTHPTTVPAENINSLEKKTSKLTDKQLKGKFAEFKLQHERGKTLDELLPEVFACVRESAKRNLKQRHFTVQLMASIVLHQGKIAEQ